MTHLWDSEGRLVQSTHTDGTVVGYLHDVDGNRVRTTVSRPEGSPMVTNYLVDPRYRPDAPRSAGLAEPPNPTGEQSSGSLEVHQLSHVVAETDESGTLLAHYLRGGDELLAVVRPAGTRFYHADGLGSIRQLTNETGEVTDTYRYTAFGEMIEHVGTDPNPYLFAGESADPTGQFGYHRARWYDLATGRFLSKDPFEGFIDQPESLHRYNYASHNPVNVTDPSGEIQLAEQLQVPLKQGILGRIRQIAARKTLRQLRTKIADNGLHSYKDLKQLIKEKKIDLDYLDLVEGESVWAHHVIPEYIWKHGKLGTFKKIWVKANLIPAVPVGEQIHKKLNSEWNDCIPDGRGKSKVPDFDLFDALVCASKVYNSDPRFAKIFHAIFQGL